MPTATELDYFLFSGVGGIVDENEMKLTGPRNGAFPPPPSAILSGNGESPRGWKQNTHVRMNPESRTYTLTPEYHAVRLYAGFIPPASRIMAYHSASDGNTPVLAAITPSGEYVIEAANFNDQPVAIAIGIGGKFLNLKLRPHSLNTCLIPEKPIK